MTNLPGINNIIHVQNSDPATLAHLSMGLSTLASLPIDLAYMYRYLARPLAANRNCDARIFVDLHVRNIAMSFQKFDDAVRHEARETVR